MKISDMNFELLMESLNFFGIKRDLEIHIHQLNNGVKKVNIGVLNTITTAAEKLLLKIATPDVNSSVFDKMTMNDKFLYQTEHIIDRLKTIREIYLENVFDKSILQKLVMHIDDLIKRLTEANAKVKNEIDKSTHLKDIENDINADLAKNGEGKISLDSTRITKQVPKGLAVDLHSKKHMVAKNNKLT